MLKDKVSFKIKWLIFVTCIFLKFAVIWNFSIFQNIYSNITKSNKIIKLYWGQKDKNILIQLIFVSSFGNEAILPYFSS